MGDPTATGGEATPVGGMTVVVERLDHPAVEWPAWQVPAQAVGEWLQLQAVLAAMSADPPCSQEPELWFAGAQSPRLEEAVAGCGSCPALHPCASYAVAADERSGVWGSLTEADRRRLAGRRR